MLFETKLFQIYETRNYKFWIFNIFSWKLYNCK